MKTYNTEQDLSKVKLVYLFSLLSSFPNAYGFMLNIYKYKQLNLITKPTNMLLLDVFTNLDIMFYYHSTITISSY